MAARGRPRRGGGSNLPLILGVGVVTTALLAYVIAIWATVDGIPAVVKGASANVGRAVLIRGAVMNVVPVPLTKAGAYAVGDQDTAIWVITTKGLPVVGDRWLVQGTLRAGLDGQGLAKAIGELTGGIAPGTALDAFAQRLTNVRIGAYVEERRRHQWTFAPWI